MIKAYLNELSVDGQNHSVIEFEDALNSVCSSLFRLTLPGIKEDSRLHYSRQLLHRTSGPDTAFLSHLNHVRDKSIRTRFLSLIMNGAVEWEDARLHDTNVIYEWENTVVTDTSVAEAAEDSLSTETAIILLSFGRSRFAGCDDVLVRKNGAGTVSVSGSDSPPSFDEFLESVLGLERLSYRPESRIPPLDFQTVLRDRVRFAPVPHRFVKGRRVFCETATGRYWHTDSCHFGQSAHLEVYESTRQHIGEARLDGEMMPETAVDGRMVWG